MGTYRSRAKNLPYGYDKMGDRAKENLRNLVQFHTGITILGPCAHEACHNSERTRAMAFLRSGHGGQGHRAHRPHPQCHVSRWTA